MQKIDLSPVWGYGLGSHLGQKNNQKELRQNNQK
jgi:hypothetical protein